MFLPTYAAADWSPRPALFNFAATLETCTLAPDTPDLARACDGALASAYALKRAVARATFKCGTESLLTCAAPFEDEGLPAIAARIAVDAGCDNTDASELAEGAPIPADHCITIASDIMIDEGIVPLDTDISCGISWIECGELAQLNAAFWVDQVDLLAPADPVVSDLQMRNFSDCNVQAGEIGGWASDLDALECLATRSAALWADLTQTEQEN